MKKTLIFTLIFLFSLSFISAQPPFQESDPSVGLQLEAGIPSTHLLGDDYYLHTHVYNATTGLLITSGLNCYYHFYNHQINGGEHISVGNLSQYGMGYFNYVDGSLINETGEYSALIWCNTTTEGGFLQYRFDVNLTGVEGDNLWMNFLIIFLLTGGSFSIIYLFGETQRGDGSIYYNLGAFMLFAVGVYTTINGFGGYKTLLTQAMGFIIWGAALFFLTKPWFEGKKFVW